MKLVIVESPAKAKTIKGFLGNDFVVIASRGHVSDLSKHGVGIKLNDDGTFVMNYETTKDHMQVAKDIKYKAKEAEVIYLATDEDREGEAIAYRIVKDILNGKVEDYPRIAFHEITKTAILNALNNPRKLNLNMVNAQITRRALDRIVGYWVTGLLRKKFVGGYTAGRVQSPVLNFVYKREMEIEAFKPTKYYAFFGNFTFHNGKKEMKFDKCEMVHFSYGEVTEKDRVIYVDEKSGQKLTIFLGEEETKKAFNFITESAKTDPFRLKKYVVKENQKLQPKPPFVTSTLQQYMSNKAGFSPTKTMSIAQKLYEGIDMPSYGKTGAITYMRTDSLNISKEASKAATDYIVANYGKEYVPETYNTYVTTSKGAQEAHEAIRPTHVDFTPELARKTLEPDEAKVYIAIWERFMASQSVSNLYESHTLYIGNKHCSFTTHHRKVKFDGWCKIASSSSPEVKTLGDFDFSYFNNNYNDPSTKVKEYNLEMEGKETKAPNRYTEAGLIREMESTGIGRPSTYASTVALLVNRNYIAIENKAVKLTMAGRSLIEKLKQLYDELIETNFTYNVEENLDLISEGKEEWEKYFRGFYLALKEKLDALNTSIESEKTVVDTGRKCPKCNGALVVKTGKYDKFVACSNFPKCKYVDNENKEKKPVESIGKCPNCGNDIVKKNGKKGEFYACSGFPKCVLAFSFPISDKKCPECSSIGYEQPTKEGNKFYCLKRTCKNFKQTKPSKFKKFKKKK